MGSKPGERLMHDHEELGDLLVELLAALTAQDIARSYATLDLFWTRLAIHIRAEHLRLFPAIYKAMSRGVTPGQDIPLPSQSHEVIEELRRDHDFFMRALSQAVAVMRKLLADPDTHVAEKLEDVRKRVDAVQKRLVKHNEIEEEGIYLWTRNLLGEAEQANLAKQLEKELNNIPPRFKGRATH